MRLDNKIALITGAGRGIGKAIAATLKEAGATVVGADITGADFSLDVTNQESILDTLKTIKEQYGSPDIVVNNAGITRDNLMLRMKAKEWHDVIATNLTGVYNVTQAFLRDMLKARWGRIINITSIVAYSGNPGQANYAAAKAGMIGFSRSLALEVAGRGITVNCIAPGFIDTVMTQQLTAEQQEKLLAMIPLHKIGTVEDVANTVLFLASDMAAYITGQTIHVNGGMFMG